MSKEKVDTKKGGKRKEGRKWRRMKARQGVKDGRTQKLISKLLREEGKGG